jgi:heat shock protein HtpX
MATLYTHQDSNVRKTWFLMTMFLVVIIAIGFVFSQIYGNSNFVVIAVVFSLFMNFFSYWYSDKIVLKMAGAVPASHEENKELYHIVENLSITAGLPMPKVYIINELAPNAFATGRDKEHAVVAVTTGLMQTLNKTELEGVIAHELSHIGNRDILISTIVVVLVGFVAILSDFFLRSRMFGRGDRDNKAGGILIVVGIVLAILAPIATRLIHLAISRKREFLADASGALLTRYPEGLASALEKISKNTVPMRRASQATAHLYISNPFSGQKISKLFSTHPPVEDRVAALRGLGIK